MLINRIFGIPLVSYYDDMGSMVPSELARPALETIRDFLFTLMVYLNNKKTDLGEEVTFLGLLGDFPRPGNKMTLSITLPEEKKADWVALITEIQTLGVVSRDQLASLVGGLSFSQTSIFGRFGRPMLTPLHVKLNATQFRPQPSGREKRILQWRPSALPNMGPRQVRDRSGRPDMVVFTDAASSTSIIAAVTINRTQFIQDETICEARYSTTGKQWETLFDSTNLIYGLEMLALLAILYRPNNLLYGKNATFHIDNGNALEAAVKNNARPLAIVAMTQLVWRRLYVLDITAWFEWVPGTRNIADLPTRKVAISFKSEATTNFGDLRSLLRIVKKAEHAEFPSILGGGNP